MADEERRSRFFAIFEDVEPEERELVNGLIEETLYLEGRMRELKAMPFLSVHPRKPAIQRQTAAAKQYKECSQSYANNIRILLNVLRKVGPTAQDELLKRLEEFE